MITQRAVLFGFVGFCLYLIAIVNGLPPFYYALTWLTAGILFSSLGIALLSLFGLRCAWTMEEACVAERPSLTIGMARDDDFDDDFSSQSDTDGAGQWLQSAGESGAAGVQIVLANGGTLNKTGIVIEVYLRAVRPERSVDSDDAEAPRALFQKARREPLLMRRFLIEALASGAQLTTNLPLYDLPRGRYTIKELRLVGSDVMGLFRVRKTVPANSSFDFAVAESASASEKVVPARGEITGEEPAKIIVGPAMVATHSHVLMQMGGGGSGVDAGAMLGQGDEVRGTRPYVAGDDLRFVHWKSTARRGELVVREFHRTARNQCIVIWDGAAFSAEASGASSNGNGASSEKRISISAETALANAAAVEFGLRLVACLCHAVTQSGQPCALLRLDEHPLWVPPAARGGSMGSMSRVIEALSDAGATRQSPLSSALSISLRDAVAGSGVYVVSASPNSELVAGMQTLRAARLRVAACLVDSAAFVAPPAPHIADALKRNRHAPPRSGPDSPLFATERALREAGVAVVVVPRFDASEVAGISRGWDQSGAIRGALRELLSSSADVAVSAEH